MNRVTRLLTLVGVGIAAGVTIGAGPASAATTTGSEGTHTASAQSSSRWDDDDDDDYRLVRIFDTRRQCSIVGRIGERRDRWDDYACFPVRSGFGFGRGDWALVVSDDDECDWDDYRDDRFDYRHGYFGGGGFGSINSFNNNGIGNGNIFIDN